MAKISDDILEVQIAPSKISGKDSFYGHPGEVIFHSLEELMELAGFRSEDKANYIALSSRLKQVGKELTAKGQSHDNGFFETFFSITGAFDGVDDQFQEGRNEVHVHARLEPDWKDYTAKCKVRTGPVPSFTAQLSSAHNFTSDTSWDDKHQLAVQAGQLIILQGENLKVSGKDSGLELENLADGKTQLIRRFSTNKPKELQWMFPSIPAGSYRVTLKTYYRSGTDYVTQKTALLPVEFTVT